mgnify:CR=1 FL=1
MPMPGANPVLVRKGGSHTVRQAANLSVMMVVLVALRKSVLKYCLLRLTGLYEAECLTHLQLADFHENGGKEESYGSDPSVALLRAGSFAGKNVPPLLSGVQENAGSDRYTVG